MINQAKVPTSRVESDSFDRVLQKSTRSTCAILTFFVLAFAWSWANVFLGTRAKVDYPVLSKALMIAAGFGPSFAGLAVIVLFSNGAKLRHWVARCLNWRVGWRWFVLAFALPPVVMVSALAIDVLLGGSLPSTRAADQIPLVILNFGLVLLIGGPLGEEFGWRGYAMSALTRRLDWRAASLITGVFWGLWHLPLFLIAGTAQSHMPIALFMLNILAGSIVFGWLFERTQESVLPALVLHTSLNAWAGILGLVPTQETGRPYALVTVIFVLIAVVLLFSLGQKFESQFKILRKASLPC
jgi:uncharacterized protein